MPTISDLPILTLLVPGYLRRKGRWVDNGPLSNMTAGQAVIRYRSVASHYVEPAYVAAKAPDTSVPDGRGSIQPFHERVAATDPTRVKPLGKPKARGGLIDTRPDWEDVCIGAMASFAAQKFAPGTPEATWLVGQEPTRLVEYTNWGDSRWGVAFRNGESLARGRNAHGLILILAQRRLRAGKVPPLAPEAEWKELQAHLVPVMARAAHETFNPTT